MLEAIRDRANNLGIGYQQLIKECIGAYLKNQEDVAKTIDQNINRMKAKPMVEAPKGSCVYFFQSTGPNPIIKIGFTSSVEDRLATLEREHPYDLDPVLYFAPANRELETQLLMAFNKSQLRGEWFNPTPDLISYIDSKRAEVGALPLYFYRDVPPELAEIDIDEMLK
jgi:hypothetical protein